MDFVLYPVLYCKFLDFIVCTAYFNIVICVQSSDNVAIEIIKLTYSLQASNNCQCAAAPSVWNDHPR